MSSHVIDKPGLVGVSGLNATASPDTGERILNSAALSKNFKSCSSVQEANPLISATAKMFLNIFFISFVIYSL